MTSNEDRDFKNDQEAIETALLRLLSKIVKLREDFGLRATNPKIIKTVDENNCNLRIFNELTFPTYPDSIDSLYREKHDFFRDKIANRLMAEFGTTHRIHTEYNIITGRLDIAIIANNDLSLNPKIVAVEIKTGNSFDLRQSIRYLYKCKFIIVVRLLHQQVTVLSQDEHKDIILDSINTNIEKIDKILEHNLDKMPCEECQGCPVSSCEYRKPSMWKNRLNASGAVLDLQKLYRDIDMIIERVIDSVQECKK